MTITKQLRWEGARNWQGRLQNCNGTYCCDSELALCDGIVRKILKLSKDVQVPDRIEVTLSMKAPKVKGSVKLIVRPWMNSFCRKAWEYARTQAISTDDCGMFSYAMELVKDLCRMEGVDQNTAQFMWLTVRSLDN